MFKRLFLLVAVLALAMVAQAETTTWQNTFYTDETVVYRPGTTDTFREQHFYIVYGSLSIDELWEYKDASVNGYDAGSLKNYIVEFAVSSDGRGPVDDGWGGISGNSVESETAPAYRLLWFESNLDDYPENDRKYFLSSNITPSGQHEEIDISEFFAEAGVAGNWQNLPAPEPTSGLLILLGLAGLSLKRRQV